MGEYFVDAEAGVPPFEQLRIQVVERIATGDLPPGTRLPTVRAMAGDLGLAVNTVAKAYRALEAEGAVVTEGRRGTFVPATEVEQAAAAASAYVSTARRLGIARAEAVRLVERAW